MPNFSRFIKTLYHFTDRSNLQAIKQAGGLLSWARLQEMKVIVPRPGGNDLSHTLDARFKGDTYVHLCFFNQHPMEYRARTDGRIVDPFFLTISPAILDQRGVLFSEEVSNKSGVPLIDRAQANKVFDFEVMHGRPEFKDPEIMSRVMKARKYEALIPAKVPLNFISNFPNNIC